MKTGRVLFIGAGPGDPTLLTIKGMEALRQADVVVYDRLANPQLLSHVRRDARFIYCGKESDRHTIPQDEINRILIREAQIGQTVVRLKGGDPSVFGRVGEEALMCQQHGIPYEIIPGITSGIAAPLYAGIPLTHREHSSSVAFITGHLCEKNSGKELDWAALARVETLVIYMGVKNLPYIREKLLTSGKSPSVPVALVRWGTLAEQKTLVGTLETIDKQAADAGFAAPAIIVIGDVVGLRDSLNWYESKPLFGHRVAVASLAREGEGIAAVLAGLGADLLTIPLVEKGMSAAPDREGVPIDLDAYEWLVFGDERQVSFFFQELRKRRYDLRRLRGKIAARGMLAAEELERRGVYPELVLKETAPLASVHQTLPVGNGSRVLVMANDKCKVVLHAQGTALHMVQAGVVEWDRVHPVAALLAERPIDWLAADDPYVLPALAEFAGSSWENKTILCIGNETAIRAREMGWASVIECTAIKDDLVRRVHALLTGMPHALM